MNEAGRNKKGDKMREAGYRGGRKRRHDERSKRNKT